MAGAFSMGSSLSRIWWKEHKSGLVILHLLSKHILYLTRQIGHVNLVVHGLPPGCWGNGVLHRHYSSIFHDDFTTAEPGEVWYGCRCSTDDSVTLNAGYCLGTVETPPHDEQSLVTAVVSQSSDDSTFGSDVHNIPWEKFNFGLDFTVQQLTMLKRVLKSQRSALLFFCESWVACHMLSILVPNAPHYVSTSTSREGNNQHAGCWHTWARGYQCIHQLVVFFGCTHSWKGWHNLFLCGLPKAQQHC